MTNAHSLLNQIFYPTNKFDVGNLHELERHFYGYKEPLAQEPSLVQEPIVLLPASCEIPQASDEIPQTLEKMLDEMPQTLEKMLDEMPQTLEKIPQASDEIPQIFHPVPKSVPTPMLTPAPMSAPIKKTQRWFEPLHSDTIFWCIYQHVYGQYEYDRIGSKFGNKILEEKQKIMEHFNKSPKLLKSSNVKFTNDRIKEVISEFMCAKNCSSFLETAAYAIYYNLSIYFVDEIKKTYMVFKNTEQSDEQSENKCVLYRCYKNNVAVKGKYRTTESHEDFDTYLKLEQFDKPLRAVSTYKVSELDQIAHKVGIKTEEKMKKGDLYNMLALSVAWL